MHKTHGHGSLAHRRRYPVHGSRPNIARGKNTGATGFQQVGFPAFFPDPFKIGILTQIPASSNEAFGVFNDAHFNPVRKGFGANEYK